VRPIEFRVTDDVRARVARIVDSAFQLSRREDRWLAMGDTFVAFAANDDAEWARLRSVAQLIERWHSAGVPVPRVIDECDQVLVRERLDGIMGEIVEPLLFGSATLTDLGRISPFTRAGERLPWALPDGFTRLDAGCPLSPFGARLAQSYGEMAARMHGAIAMDEISGITVRPPMDLDAALDRLRATSVPRELVEKAERERAWIAEGPANSVIVHGDLHFHNMCLAQDGSIIGVFDLGDAHADGPESEFHYVHSLGPRFVEIATAAYGAPLDGEAVRRAHVRTALGHLEWVGHDSPRHPSIISWVTAVLTRLVPTHAIRY
jgi:hypothetical protein